LIAARGASLLRPGMSLRLHEVTRRFGSQLALDAVSLHVRRGDCYGFIGHNGAGKTTAMRIVLGLQRADSGSVQIDGFDARAHPREARARLGGLIEVPGFHAALDGATNLGLVGRLTGLERREARAQAGRLLDLVGLPAVGRKPVGVYSHGMRQRLGIALALVGKPAYVLLDEPTNGLDPQGIAEIRLLLRRLVDEEGVTVMLSSHQLHELAEVCNRIGVLHRGRLVVEAETSELLGGGDRRYLLRTDDPARASALLSGLGARPEAAAAGESLIVDLGAVRPRDASRALVQSGLALEVFAPQPSTLEEIYLRTATAENAAASRRAGEALPPASAPPERRARGFPTLRMARYEATVWARRRTTLVLLLLPAALGVAAVLRRRAEFLAAQEKIARGELFSTTDVTAFEGAGIALRAGLPLLALVVAGLASQALAGEYARGTLRNVLMRPLGRMQVATGKALTHLSLALLAYAALAALGLTVAGWAFGYRDLVEILPNGESFPLAAARDLAVQLRAAVISPLPALAACAGLGFAAGALCSSAAGALASALGAVLFLDLSRSVARGLDLEGFLPTAYLPSPLGDTSFLKLYSDVAQGISNSTFAYADTRLTVPFAWLLASFLLACLVLARRSVP
jgi:ABC-type multidrug transport system ATPase subunit/ABC-type transport system involved in multi-copper enzyme maturation permease subunit